MLPEFNHAPQGPATPRAERAVGVGIDVSRYGHYAAFLRDDLQTAADELAFAESAQGYEQLRTRFDLERIVGRNPQADTYATVVFRPT